MKVYQQQRRDALKLLGKTAFLGLAAKTLIGCGKTETKGISQIHPLPIPSQNSGENVQTVRGLMSREYLGITDMHEHVLRDQLPGIVESTTMFDLETLKKMAMLSSPEEVPDSFFPEENHPITLNNRHYLTHFYANAENQFLLDKDLMLTELEHYAYLGGKSILDCSITYERGTPEVVKEMSEQSGVNIIMSTGINSHVLLPKKYKAMSVEQLTEFFEKEIHVGIGDSNIKCGNIKLLAESAHYGVKATEDETLLKGLQAAARISSNSGVPVTVHAYLLDSQVFKEFLNKAISFGMPAKNMIISHFPTMLRPMDIRTLVRSSNKFAPNLDLGYWAMDKGFVLSFDLFGSGTSWVDSRDGLIPTFDPVSISAIYQYVKAGYGDRIVLGTDTWMRNSTKKYGGAGIAHLLNFVVPKLLEVGLQQRDIDQIMIKTPARLLAFA